MAHGVLSVSFNCQVNYFSTSHAASTPSMFDVIYN